LEGVFEVGDRGRDHVGGLGHARERGHVGGADVWLLPARRCAALDAIAVAGEGDAVELV
jgi:hypothetical protein